jgi:predicted DNA-binding transcriptional regulator YafY
MKNNRLQRLSYILTHLSYGEKLSTKKLSEHFEISIRKIQLDFNEYILPYFDDIVYYDFGFKCYISKTNFLHETLLNSEELAVVSILKTKAKDKSSNYDLSLKAVLLFDKLENSLKNSIYENSSMECFEENKDEIVKIRNAIKAKNEILCKYNDKERNLYPLKILNLDTYWYLINYDLEYEEVRKYHLNSISNISIIDKNFEFDNELLESFDNAINAYFKPQVTPFAIELFLHKKVSQYFMRKPINNTQRVLKNYEDGSLDVEIYITCFMEIIPTIQKYLPYIGVITPNELEGMIVDNLDEYLDKIT